MVIGVVGLEPDGLAVFGDGGVEFALGTQPEAQIVVCPREVGPESNRLAILRDRAVEVPFAL